MASDRQPKQSRSVNKSAGSRDAKSLAANPNRDAEAPDMPDAEREHAIAERLGSRGHGSKQAVQVARVLQLAERGYSPMAMHKDKRRAKGLPHWTTIYSWMREDPDFAEDYKSRYRLAVDDAARQLLHITQEWGNDSNQIRSMLKEAKKLPKILGLKPAEQVQAVDKMLQRTVDINTALVNAQDKRVHRTLQIAARQLPNDWGEHSEGESSMVVLDVSLGVIKTMGLPGSVDGQNVLALKAGRWNQKALPAPEDVPGAGGGAR